MTNTVLPCNCGRAIRALHGSGRDNSPELIEPVKDAQRYICDLVKEILDGTISETMSTALRKVLHDLHPSIAYERPLSVARDLLDIAVTLEGMTVFEGGDILGENFVPIRTGHTKIGDAVLFFEHLCELQQ